MLTYRLEIVLSPGRRQNTSKANELAAVDTKNKARSTISSASRSLSITSDINVCPGDKKVDFSNQKSSLYTCTNTLFTSAVSRVKFFSIENTRSCRVFLNALPFDNWLDGLDRSGLFGRVACRSWRFLPTSLMYGYVYISLLIYSLVFM